MKSTLLWLLVLALPASAQQPPRFGAPKDYVMVLGDSLAFGYQRDKFVLTQNPDDFTFGFADHFAARVSATPPGRGTVLANLACPNESAQSFLTGPCVFHSVLGFDLHRNYSSSQVDAAEAFLAMHPGQVSPILISLGANDVFAVANGCGGLSTPCFQSQFPAVLAQLSANYAQILDRLRKAAPYTEIIILGLYNPFAVLDPSTDAVALAVNQVLQNVAAAHRARFADPYPAFNLSSPQPQVLCAATLICTLGDIHPSDFGYAVLADVLWNASGYTRFQH